MTYFMKQNVPKYLFFYVSILFNYRFVLKFKATSDTTKANANKLYLDTWRDSLIPLCADRSGRIPSLCSEFKPSLSDQGLCFTQNHAPIDDIFKPTKYLHTFKHFQVTFCRKI